MTAPKTPPDPPRPGPEWCADPRLIRTGRVGGGTLANPDQPPYWRGCRRCTPCFKRRIARQLKGRR